jgi:hypothetical protein
MMLAAEFGTGQVLWSILWLTLFVLWFWLVITVFGDIMRADHLTGWAKAMWAFGILVLPFLGVIMYLIVNGDEMQRKAVADARANPTIDAALAAGTTAEGLDLLAEARRAGTITQAEFEYGKGRVLAQ